MLKAVSKGDSSQCRACTQPSAMPWPSRCTSAWEITKSQQFPSASGTQSLVWLTWLTASFVSFSRPRDKWFAHGFVEDAHDGSGSAPRNPAGMPMMAVGGSEATRTATSPCITLLAVIVLVQGSVLNPGICAIHRYCVVIHDVKCCSREQVVKNDFNDLLYISYRRRC